MSPIYITQQIVPSRHIPIDRTNTSHALDLSLVRIPKKEIDDAKKKLILRLQSPIVQIYKISHNTAGPHQRDDTPTSYLGMKIQ